ncbi:unnamed protein product, partial [marine sediment metagenome]
KNIKIFKNWSIIMPNKLSTELWKEHPWTKQASNIVEGMDKFPTNSKVNIILRHSQRYEPRLVDEKDLKGANMELTPLGQEVAKIFGVYFCSKQDFVRIDITNSSDKALI